VTLSDGVQAGVPDMPAFLRTYHVRTTSKGHLPEGHGCQQVVSPTRRPSTSDHCHHVQQGRGHVEESPAAAEDGCRVLRQVQAGVAIVAHFRTFWLPKLSASDYICVLIPPGCMAGIGDAGPQNACCSPRHPNKWMNCSRAVCSAADILICASVHAHCEPSDYSSRRPDSNQIWAVRSARPQGVQARQNEVFTKTRLTQKPHRCSIQTPC
jgi:hypothetical protein